MQRTIMGSLEAWLDSPRRKPLLLQGARQVGKTWAIRELGRMRFEQVAYVNFLDDESLARVFDGDLHPERILDAIALQTGIAASSPGTLVVLDEIQECPRALTSLKMFAEQRPDLPVIAAGSLLGVALHRGVSFPVGKVDHLLMYPMTFHEYLLATDAPLAKVLAGDDASLVEAFADRCVEALKRYCFVGGMPEAVLTFRETGDYDQVRAVHERLLFDYERDFSKHADPALAEKIRMIWASTPAQLGRQNKKFVYSAVRKGARARGYEEAIQWLVDAGLVLRVNRIAKPGLPLAAYADRDAFKLYLFDTGLLGAASNLGAATLIRGSELFTEFKGALAENYVCQQLVASGKVVPFYWSAENSSGAVDFVYEHAGKVVPVEVKAEVNLRAKSLRSFMEKYAIAQGLRLSLAGRQDQGWVVNVPLYECDLLPDRLPELAG